MTTALPLDQICDKEQTVRGFAADSVGKTQWRVRPRTLPPKTTAEDEDMLSQAVLDRYRCPKEFLGFVLSGDLSSNEHHFHFGANTMCYGKSCCSDGQCEAASSYDALEHTVIDRSKVVLPFDPTEVIDNLRLERYQNSSAMNHGNLLKRVYYLLRPLTTVATRRRIQKFHARGWQKKRFPHWPVDTTVENICETLLLMSLRAKGIDKVPFIWFWPRGARGCVVMTHDVESAAGRDSCADLLDIDDSYGMKASFQIVPEERYAVPAPFLDAIRDRGCEIGIQDLNHDGRLFDNREEFRRRVALINRYGREYGAKGFRAAVLYRKPEWYEDLEFSFDMSMPNVAHLDPQRGGCCTVMPYFIGKILELPVTTSQDYTLFHLLDDRSIDLWKNQVQRILEKNGLVSFIIHPDYIREQDTRSVYEALLGYLRELREKTPIWFALPGEIDSWWRARSQMSVVRDGSSWRIEGDGAERAALAFAKNVQGKLVYELAQAAATV
jgi:hypothetical protein